MILTGACLISGRFLSKRSSSPKEEGRIMYLGWGQRKGSGLYPTHPAILYNANLQGPRQFRICEHCSLFCFCIHWTVEVYTSTFLKNFSWCFTPFIFWKIHRVHVLLQLVETCTYYIDYFQTCIAFLLSISPRITRGTSEDSTSVPKSSHSFPLLVRSVCAVQCEHPHWDALLWKAVLLLLAQHRQPTLPNEALEDVHVPSHTAVREIKNTALPSHIVLQYDDAVFFQAISAPGKKCKKVFISQVPYRWGQVNGGIGWNGGRGGRWVGKTTRLRIRRPFVHSHVNYLIAWIIIVTGAFEDLDKRTGILFEGAQCLVYRVDSILPVYLPHRHEINYCPSHGSPPCPPDNPTLSSLLCVSYTHTHT